MKGFVNKSQVGNLDGLLAERSESKVGAMSDGLDNT